MKNFVILGAGTAGTIVAQKMRKQLDPREWSVILVDKDENHYYQPGFLFVPFGIYKPEDTVKPKRNFFPSGVEFILSDIELIEPDENRVTLSLDKRVIHFDYLVIATGADIHPAETEGMLGAGWRKNVFDFYTYEGSASLANFLQSFQGGRVVVNITEMPIKCPVAPLEWIFLADYYFRQKGIRNKVELIYATPLPGAFTKPVASKVLGDLLVKKNIHIEPDFAIMEVDSSKNVIRSYDEREVPYDLLVTVPTNMGADVISRSGMGDELGFVPTNKHTLQSVKWPNVFVVGDATNVPASKAGSVVHFELETLIENILRHMRGKELEEGFDGHANCFVESGFNKAILIDFNYDVEPLTGTYPFPILGPMNLLGESYLNHLGKLAFRWMYWNIMLKGGNIPLPSRMSMVGKRIPAELRLPTGA